MCLASTHRLIFIITWYKFCLISDNCCHDSIKTDWWTGQSITELCGDYFKHCQCISPDHGRHDSPHSGLEQVLMGWINLLMFRSLYMADILWTTMKARCSVGCWVSSMVSFMSFSHCLYSEELRITTKTQLVHCLVNTHDFFIWFLKHKLCRRQEKKILNLA